MADYSLHIDTTLSQEKEIETLLRKQCHVVYELALLSMEMSKILHKTGREKELVERWYLLLKQLM